MKPCTFNTILKRHKAVLVWRLYLSDSRVAKTNPRVNIVRTFFHTAIMHLGITEYNFSTRRIGFEVFRFDDSATNQAVEHWDNIQPRMKMAIP